MLETLVTWLQSVILPLGVTGVFLGSLIEEVIAFIPSAMVQMASGLMFLGGQPLTASSFLHLFLVVSIPASIGVTIGSLVVYTMSYHVGEPALEKYGKYIGFSKYQLEKLQKKLSRIRTDELLILVARALPIVPSVVPSAFAGLIKMPLKSYLFFTLIGTLVRTTIYGFIGWQVGTLYTAYAKETDHVELIGSIIVLLIIFGYLIYKKRKNRVY